MEEKIYPSASKARQSLKGFKHMVTVDGPGWEHSEWLDEHFGVSAMVWRQTGRLADDVLAEIRGNSCWVVRQDGRWYYTQGSFWFKSQKDAAIFKLRFG